MRYDADEEVCFYVEKIGIFVNCGIDPICEDIFLEPEEYASQAYLHIKIKKTGFSMVHRLLSLEQVVQQADEEAEIDYVEPEVPAKPKTRRIKERRIGHIIEKVIEWRNYYTGESGVRGAKFSLEEAAHYVKISKKSLDDYLFQIRYGHQHHFNFNEHYNDKVGVLRDFVRQ